MDLHDEFERHAHALASESGSRLRGAEVRSRLEGRVTRGRRLRSVTVGAGTVAAVGVLAVGAVMVPRLGDQSLSPASGGAMPAFSTDPPTMDSSDLPTVQLGDFQSVFGLHGPEDGIVDEPAKVSQEIPEQFACGAEWTLDPGHYLNSTVGRFAEFTDGVSPNETVLDVTASDVTFVSQAGTWLGNYRDSFVLAWVKNGVIVGNARVTRAYGPLIEGTAGERLSTVRGATAVGADAVQLPLAGPGTCEVGAAPADLGDGTYELHVIHEYGESDARIDGHGTDPTVPIAPPTEGQLVEFISADPYGAVVDPTGGPWTVEVVGLDSTATATAEPQVATAAPSPDTAR